MLGNHILNNISSAVQVEIAILFSLDAKQKLMDIEIWTQNDPVQVSIPHKKINRILRDRLVKHIYFCHNHPEGFTSPSRADINFTKALKEEARLHNAILEDHLIICEESCYSFKWSGLLDTL